LLLALPPQRLLFLKYALESDADIDFALRGINDGQLYNVQNVDLAFLLNQFNIELPANLSYTVDQPLATIPPVPGVLFATPTPTPPPLPTAESEPGVGLEP
jgi:hypothetical protein